MEIFAFQIGTPSTSWPISLRAISACLRSILCPRCFFPKTVNQLSYRRGKIEMLLLKHWFPFAVNTLNRESNANGIVLPIWK